MILSCVGLATMATALPLAVAIDFGSLPPRGVGAARYNMQFEIVLKTGKVEKFNLDVGANVGNDDLAAHFAEFPDDRWEVRVDKMIATVVGFNGTPLRSLTVASTGQKPTIRWVLHPHQLPMKK